MEDEKRRTFSRASWTRLSRGNWTCLKKETRRRRSRGRCRRRKRERREDEDEDKRTTAKRAREEESDRRIVMATREVISQVFETRAAIEPERREVHLRCSS